MDVMYKKNLDPDAEKGFSRIQEKNTGNSGTIVADA